MITMTKRFYPSRSAIRVQNLATTYGQALEQAKKKLAESDDEEYYIVEIIAVVKRETPPVIVEKVRRS